jgi:hypothetical protein
MSYFPPQVEVTQVQKTVSPTLIQPDLVPAVIGPAYYVKNIDSSKASEYPQFNGSETTLTLSGLETGMALDTTSVYVDLVMLKTGTETTPVGSRLIIASGLSATGFQITIPANANYTGASIYAGFRALRSDYAEVKEYDSVQTVLEEFEDNSSLNPLGFALTQALNNGNAAVYGYGTVVDDFDSLSCSVSGVSSAATSHALALDAFETREVYALVPVTYDTAIISSYKTHANSMSLPTAKRERIVVSNPKIPWGADKATTALAVSTASAGLSEKRVIYTFPDIAFVRELRHVSTLNPAYIEALYSNGLGVTVNAYLDQRVTFSATNSVVSYRSYTVRPATGLGTEITATLFQALLSHAQETADPYFYAYIPVPGSVAIAPSVAGQIAGNTPQQPLTNLALAGLSSVKYSSDYFTEANLNTIAQGGNYILKQAKIASPIVCRHQLTTDMSSIEKREVSIIKTVDYTAKFIRGVVDPYIGKYVINKATLDAISFAIKGAGELLVRDGVLNGFDVVSVAQDPVSKDTVLVSVTILPPYPVNYIKIDLIF